MRRRVPLAALSLALALALGASALAQEPAPAPSNGTLPPGFSFVPGGEPGIHVLLEGVDVERASTPHDAFRVDPARAANVTFTFAPPPNVTWRLREVKLGLLVGGEESEPPEKLTQHQAFDATIPPGSTVFVNRTVDLGPVKSVGTGLFRMRVEVVDADGGALYAGTFFVHVTGNVLLTVAGAAVTVASVGTGYGLWRILQDARELFEARERHKKREASARAEKAKKLTAGAVALAGGLEGLVSAAQKTSAHAERLEKRAPIKWTLTGLGLGAVTMSWLQFLGYVPLDLGATLVTTLSVGAVFLTLVLLALALKKRFAAARAKEEEEAATRTLVPEGPPADAAALEERASDAPTRTGPRR